MGISCNTRWQGTLTILAGSWRGEFDLSRSSIVREDVARHCCARALINAEPSPLAPCACSVFLVAGGCGCSRQDIGAESVEQSRGMCGLTFAPASRRIGLL